MCVFAKFELRIDLCYSTTSHSYHSITMILYMKTLCETQEVLRLYYYTALYSRHCLMFYHCPIICVFVCACMHVCAVCMHVLCVIVCMCVHVCVYPPLRLLKTTVKYTWNNQLYKKVIPSLFIRTINIIVGYSLSNKVCYEWLSKEVKLTLYHTQTHTQ